MTQEPTYDLDALRAAVEKAPRDSMDMHRVIGAGQLLLNAARSGLLDDAALGREHAATITRLTAERDEARALHRLADEARREMADEAKRQFERAEALETEKLAVSHKVTALLLRVVGAEGALRLAQPIVEADYHAAKDACDADWEGQAHEALTAINTALAAKEPGRG